MDPAVDFDVRVFTDSCQGGRKYMEDTFCVAFQHEVDGSSISDHCPDPDAAGPDAKDQSAANVTAAARHRKYVYAGIFDGHGGKEAALFARDHLLHNIVSQKDFWSQNDDDAVLRAIRNGFMSTHFAMLKELGQYFGLMLLYLIFPPILNLT
jgi:serine/threonine protein phosphatase PrpC